MIVKKCDVCGKVYNGHLAESITETIGQLVIRYPNTVDPDTGMQIHDRKAIDLCPECTGKVEQFISVLGSGEDYRILVDPDRYDLVLREE